MFSNPFAYFVFLSWSGFVFAFILYVFIWKIAHFKQYVEKW